MLVDELKSLFSHGAFADPRKPAVLLNLYHTADRAAGFAVMSSEALAAAAAASAAVSSSALGDPSSSVLNSIHSAIKKLSKDESVLPQVPNWDARSRIFTALRDNMVACPLLSDPEIKQHKLMTALLTSRTNRMRQRFIDFIKEARLAHKHTHTHVATRRAICVTLTCVHSSLFAGLVLVLCVAPWRFGASAVCSATVCP